MQTIVQTQPSQIAVFTSQVLTSIDQRNMKCGAVFVDLKRAFDYVDPLLLLQSLHTNYNLNSNLLNILGSYCTNRSFKISFDEFTSTSYTFSSACPQGSTLAPLLFMLFFDKIDQCIELKYLPFADDLVIYAASQSVDTIVQQLKDSLVALLDWCSTNKLIINFSKTKWILFSKTNKTKICTPVLSVNNQVTEYVKSFKYLGIWMDESFSFTTHYEHVFHKLCSTSVWIFKLKRLINHSLFKSILHAFILSLVDYCLPIWGNMHNKFLDKMQSKIIKRKNSASYYFSKARKRKKQEKVNVK